MERNAFAPHAGAHLGPGDELGARIGGRRSAPGRKIDDRADGALSVRERHARAAVKVASDRAQVGTNFHNRDYALGRHLHQGDSHESRKERFEKLL